MIPHFTNETLDFVLKKTNLAMRCRKFVAFQNITNRTVQQHVVELTDPLASESVYLTCLCDKM